MDNERKAFEAWFESIEIGDGDIPLPKSGDGKAWDEFVSRHALALGAWQAGKAHSSPPVADRSFWVIEQFVGGRSFGYWDGANSRRFTFDIEKAVQFCRHEDAFWATRGWHWNDTKATEHVILGAAPPSDFVSCVRAIIAQARGEQ